MGIGKLNSKKNRVHESSMLLCGEDPGCAPQRLPSCPASAQRLLDHSRQAQIQIAAAPRAKQILKRCDASRRRTSMIPPGNNTLVDLHGVGPHVVNTSQAFIQLRVLSLKQGTWSVVFNVDISFAVQRAQC